MPTYAHRRLLLSLAAVLALLLSAAGPTYAGCNLIPQAQPAFRGALGTLDRPYAAPGDFVDVNVRQALCDGASPGISSLPTDNEVTLVFNPNGGPRRAIVLTTAPCASLAARLDACQDAPGIANGGVTCIQVNQPGDPAGLGIANPDGSFHLRFRFPETDALLAPAGDRRGFTGPVTIAVTQAGAALPCGLATSTCASSARGLGLLACVDDLYDADGTCQPNRGETFSQFVALPVPNDFQAGCYETSPPCTATATEVRFTLDRDGNLLFPVHWQGVLPSQSPRPVPRSLRVTVRTPVAITIPDRTFLSSFTPEGQPLPPIFEPQAGPTPAQNVLNIFGTSDAPSTVLRIAQRRGRCSGGANDGAACAKDATCGSGGTCVDACVGGANDGLVCTAKKDCPDGACGALFDAEDLGALATGGGPLVVPRLASAEPGGVCQAPPFNPCASNGDCGSDPCVSYAFEAQDPVSLESVSNGSTGVLALTAPETLAIVDRTGDNDEGDLALTVRNRTTGETQPLGAPAGTNPSGLTSCGLTGTPLSRAVIQVPVPPFTTTALATEGNVAAFLESENGEGYCNENGDADFSDAILRVFTVPGNERTASLTPPRAVDPALRLNGQSLALSDGKVFFRSSEAAMAKRGLLRVSVADGIPGAEANQYTFDAQFSKNGRWVVFSSAADNLIGPGADTNVALDVFVRDRLNGTTRRVSLDEDGDEVFAPDTSGVVGLSGSISANGRYVAFMGYSNNIVPGDTNMCFSGPCSDIFLHDRDTDDDDVFDEAGFVSTTRISLGPAGVQGDGHSNRPVISADGKFVVFESFATNLVADDTNGEQDIFVRDLDAGVTERVSVANDGSENLGIQSEDREYDISDDGRYVVFDLRTTNLPDGPEFSHYGPNIDVFVYDRDTDTTDQMTTYSDGEDDVVITSEFAFQPRMSGDGRWVVFQNEPDFSGQGDILIRDRVRDTEPELVNVPVGEPIGPTYLCQFPDVSDDGRFVTFWSGGAHLIDDLDANGGYDLFVRDRTAGTLERLTVKADGHEGGGDDVPHSSSISADGREALFVSEVHNLLGVDGDMNNGADAFIRGVDAADPNGIDALLFPDGELDDTVLEVFDAASTAVTTLCPAADVAVVGDTAAFLRPESATGTAACPGGSLNAGISVTDTVVQYWPGSGGVQNFAKAATAIALTSTHVAAIVSEAAEGGGSLNTDMDPLDGVVAVRSVSGGGWTNVGQAADQLLACGSVFAFLTPEAAENATPLNGDGDDFDRIVRIYVPATATLIDTGQAATELVCNDKIVAFRTSEMEQGEQNLLTGMGTVSDFNATFVMQGYDLTRPECLTPGHPADCLVNSHRAARVCDLEACDPRVPYRLIGTGVKFIAHECEQRGPLADNCEFGGLDINGNLRDGDLVLLVFDIHAATVNLVGSVSGVDPLQGGEDDDAGTIVVTTGRCIETFTEPCTTNEQCGSGEFCEDDVCKREHRTCNTDADCPPGIFCANDDGGDVATVAASPDTDADGVPDHTDNCVYDANPAQADADGDRVGNACDLATCGDGIRSYDEVCETGDETLCPGACTACRCTTCNNVVVDPKGKVQLKTKNGAGQLGASFALTLGTYTDEPVTIALSDADSPEIAREALGALPPAGKAPFKKWVYKTKLKSGIAQVQLKKAAPSQPGVFKLAVKAKRWFTAAAADQPAASTALTVNVGTQCFRIAVTQKTD